MSTDYFYACTTCGLRSCENHETPAWDYAAYARLHKLQPEEEYIVSRLAEQPTLSAGLDELYRRMPQRWHQLLAAATIKRKQAQPA